MNELAVTIGLISLPGLVAAILADKLLVHTARWEAFKYAVYTFVFGLGAYVALQVAVSLLDSWNRHLPFIAEGGAALSTWRVLTTDAAKPVLAEIAWATALAPLLALLATACINRKWLNRVSQKIRLSSKYGDENLFSYYLNLQGVEWVYVRDIPNNLAYRGSIHSFSETADIQELVLTDATVFQNDDAEELYRVPMLYLSKPLGSFLIEAAPTTTEEGTQSEEGNQRGQSADPGEGGSYQDNRRTKARAATSAATEAPAET